jgi:hypothetical protein
MSLERITGGAGLDGGYGFTGTISNPRRPEP